MIPIALRRLHAFVLCTTVVVCVAAPEENVPKYWLTHEVNGARGEEGSAVSGAGVGSDENEKDVLRICGIFHNEAPYLREWLTHHLVLGAQKVFLYDHTSDDEFVTVAKPFIDAGVVELRYWNNGLSSVTNATSNSVQFSVQNQAYKDCMRNNFGKTQWLLFLDIDEFLFCGGKWCGGTTAASPCSDWIQKILPTVRYLEKDKSYL